MGRYEWSPSGVTLRLAGTRRSSWARRNFRSSGINKNLDLAALGGIFGFAQSKRLEASVVELEVLGQVIANHHAARLGEHPCLIGVALRPHVSYHHGQAEPVLLEILSSLAKRFLVFELGCVGFIEDLLAVVLELFRVLLWWKTRDLMFGQLVGVLVASVLEEPSQQEIMFERFHVLLECGRARFRFRGGGIHLLIYLLVVDQSPNGALAF